MEVISSFGIIKKVFLSFLNGVELLNHKMKKLFMLKIMTHFILM